MRPNSSSAPLPAHLRDCVIVGAGPGGLATSALLHKSGIEALVIDRANTVAPLWRTRYDGFRLNTSSWFSYLPGVRFPRGSGRWPERDAVVAYYERYARDSGADFLLGTEVRRIDRGPGHWLLHTSRGTINSQFVIVATGKYHTPVVPSWPGRESFSGQLVHSSEFRTAEPFRGKDVLVVGPGQSGVEIVLRLIEGGASRVRISVRSTPHMVLRDSLGLPNDLWGIMARRLPTWMANTTVRTTRRIIWGDLPKYGLPTPAEGLYTYFKRTGRVPTIDGEFVRALRQGQTEVLAAVEGFEGAEVLLTDRSRIAPDAVIAATGYRCGLEPMVGHLGVLNDHGYPEFHGAQRHPDAEGLHFVGFTDPISGNLRELRIDAAKVAKRLRGEVGRRSRIYSSPWPQRPARGREQSDVPAARL